MLLGEIRNQGQETEMERGREGGRRGKNNKNFTFSKLSLERYHSLKENTGFLGARGALGRAKTGFGWGQEHIQREGPMGLSLNLVSTGLLIYQVFVIAHLVGNTAYIYRFTV